MARVRTLDVIRNNYNDLLEDVGYFEWFDKMTDESPSCATYFIKLEFIHVTCKALAWSGRIKKDGHCITCGKFIATIKKLDTMVGLKEVVGDIDG